ncbi:MAG: hypothetical protein ACE5HD_06350 [Acidobacteriota bacterium]
MSGLEQQFPRQVRAHNVDATTPEAARACKALGFANHGLVIRSQEGEVLWAQPDHTVNIEDVRAQIRQWIRGEAASPGAPAG